MFEFSSVISLSSFIRPFPAGIGRLWLKNLTPSILHFLIFKIWIMSPTLQMQAFQGHQAEGEHVLGSNNVLKMLAVVSVQDDCLGLLSLPQNSPGSPNFLQSQPYWNVPISVIPKRGPEKSLGGQESNRGYKQLPISTAQWRKTPSFAFSLQLQAKRTLIWELRVVW